MGEHTHIHEYLIHNHLCGLNYKMHFVCLFVLLVQSLHRDLLAAAAAANIVRK